MKPDESIFQRLYSEEAFEDRYLSNPEGALDIVIPIIHTNELWEKNLISIYREIPVKRLLLGDGGCKDNSLAVAGKFPRVHVFDHTGYKTLGFSIRKLVEEVETEWFLYLHSDVYIPDGWFDSMQSYQGQYDWYECEQQITMLIEYPNLFRNSPRGFGFGGTQMGRKAAFDDMLAEIDDDYLYRNEDIVIRSLLQNKGHKWGIVESLFHYHINMHKPGPLNRKVESLSCKVSMTREEEIRTNDMQIRGYVKYMQPTPVTIDESQDCLLWLLDAGAVTHREFLDWVSATNPSWLPYLGKRGLFKKNMRKFMKRVYTILFA